MLQFKEDIVDQSFSLHAVAVAVRQLHLHAVGERVGVVADDAPLGSGLIPNDLMQESVTSSMIGVLCMSQFRPEDG